MTRSARGELEVADVIRKHSDVFSETHGASMSAEQRRVLRAVAACRTAELGGHKRRCDQCGHEEIAYNSCRNRHCPKCQAIARSGWLDAQAADLLPVPYFHVVFTLPAELSPMALQNKRIVYGILFRAASRTLLEIAADRKHLGAQIGFLAVLHTWGQNLLHHPHVHCVVPGGGLSPDGSRWISCRDNFFLPVRVLSRVFRGKFIDALREAYRSNKLQFYGQLSGLRRPEEFEKLMNIAVRNDWVVYAKAPFGGPQQVLKYLARYTHRVAIANKRLISLHGRKVTFRWKNYADANQPKTMTLDAVEFIRRFLLHVLPSGFMRVRHFGFLANRSRRTKLECCRELLASAAKRGQPADSANEPNPEAPTEASPGSSGKEEHHLCPACRKGRMLTVEVLLPASIGLKEARRSPVPGAEPITPWDTS